MTYFNDGIGPDPYPRLGGTFPFTATDSREHMNALRGTRVIALSVGDDDGGSCEVQLTISLG
jgi:hypothetical protein